MGQTIVVVSGKGGTGKTSFTAAVSTALAQQKLRTLCLDCDIGLRNLDIALGLTDRALMDFSDVIQGRCSLEEAVVRHPRVPGLYLLTAPVYLRAQDIPQDGMRRLLEDIREDFDFCLIDAPAGLGSGFRLATAAADRAIVVSTADSASLRDAQRAVLELSAFPRGSVHLSINRIQKKVLRQLHRTIDDAMDAAGLPLIGVIPEDPAVPLAANRSLPLLLTEDRYAAQAYRNIAARISGQRVPLMKIR